MDLRELMKNAGLEPPKKEPFKKTKRPPPWLAPTEDDTAPIDNQEKSECGPISDECGLNSENQPGLILKSNAEKTNDTNNLQTECGLNSENQPGLILNQPGLISENSPNQVLECGPISDECGPILKSTRAKTENQPGLISKSTRANLKKADENTPPTLNTRIRQLRKVKGNELVVIRYLASLVLSPKTRETGPVRFREIQDRCGVQYEGARTAIQQSIAKSIIDRIEVKQGTAGWSRFRFALDAYEFFRDLNTECGPISNRMRAKTENQPGLISHSSSSIKNNSSLSDSNPSHNPTTTTPNLTDLAWLDRLAIPPAAEPYLNRHHLLELVRFGFAEEHFGILQQSLDNFAWCIETGNSSRWVEPANVFIGTMRKKNFFQAPDGSHFNALRARKMLEEDQERVERALEQEIHRRVLERIEQAEEGGKPKPSLDDIPW